MLLSKAVLAVKVLPVTADKNRVDLIKPPDRVIALAVHDLRKPEGL
ncbi:TPA: hypothetical protein ACIS3Y_003685 [Salmonella enterica subsp. enterica serovar Saintpaul]